MKTSPNGAPILSGSGLQSVRDRIQQKFDEARGQGATTLVPAKPRMDRILDATPPAPRPLRPLHEIVAPVVRVCERRFHAAAVTRDYKECYEIVRPLKDANQLIVEAVEDVQQLPPQPGAKRYEVEDQ